MSAFLTAQANNAALTAVAERAAAAMGVSATLGEVAAWPCAAPIARDANVVTMVVRGVAVAVTRV